MGIRLRRFGMITMVTAYGLCAGAGEIPRRKKVGNRSGGYRPDAMRLVHHTSQGRGNDNAPRQGKCADYAIRWMTKSHDDDYKNLKPAVNTVRSRLYCLALAPSHRATFSSMT